MKQNKLGTRLQRAINIASVPQSSQSNKKFRCRSLKVSKNNIKAFFNPGILFVINFEMYKTKKKNNYIGEQTFY